MNKRRYKRLQKRAVKEHSMEDHAKALLTPSRLRAMKRIGRQRFCADPNEDDKKKAIDELDNSVNGLE